MHERLDQLVQLQKLCLIELEQAQNNAQQYSTNMKLIGEVFESNWKSNNSFLKEYDIFLTNMTNIMEVSRKYNLQMHLHNLKLKEMQDLLPKSNGKDRHPKAPIYPAEEYEQTSEGGESFIYPSLKLKELYKKDSLICGRVSYIKNFKDLSFYIIDRSSKDLPNIIELSSSLELRQYHNIPQAHEIFGLVLDNKIFRAVLSSHNLYDEEMNEVVYPCYLLDTGEVLPLKSTNIMYKLTREQQTMPALAVPCQLHTSHRNPFVNQMALQESLEKLEYKSSCYLKVVNVQDNILYVEIVEEPNQSIAAPENHLDNVSSTNLSLNSSSSSNKKVKHKQLTEEELEMLYEEPLCTSNAMKAVMGYDPQDDKRLCRFYDPKTGGCFKGVNCKLEHSPPQPEGWTKDVLPSSALIDYQHPSIVFPAGSIINITPTYVGLLDRFYAQLNNETNTPLVWNDEDIPSWRHLKKPPHMFDLVLSRYVDGLWYRAKIMSHDDDYKMFKVFYVDYGNSQIIHLRDLASLEVSMAQLPFQAVLCRIEGVRESSSTSNEDRKTGIEILCEMILNKTLDVKVASHYEDLFITFVDRKDYPLPDILVEMGYLESNSP